MAVPYIHKVFPKIAAWDAETLKRYMDPQAWAETTAAEHVKMAKRARNLGQLQNLGEPKFVGYDDNFGSGRQSLVTYTMDATFEAGLVQITILLLETDDGFRIYRLEMISEALSRVGDELNG